MASSSDKVRITYVKETALGIPSAANLTEFRKTAESLSGTPKITESNEVTGDAQPTGQLIVGLDVAGGLDGELASTKSHLDFIEAGMRSTWGGTITTGAATLSIDASAKTITRSAGSFITDTFKVNDMVALAGFANTTNNTIVQITALTATVITYAGPSDMVTEAAVASTTVTRPDYVEWGATDASFTLAKDFLDLTNKSITYPGQRIASFKLDFKYGSIGTVNFTMAGTGYELPTTPFTNGKTIDPVATESALNASSDLGVVIIDGVPASYCIEGLNLDINNNIQPVECLGSIAPQDQTPTGLSVSVGMDVFLEDSNFDLHGKKLSQTPIAISYFVRDGNNKGYAVQVPAVQLSFDDAQGGGKRQLNKLSLSGVAKRDAAFGNTIRIYKLV